jgi:hypothetical protein
VWRGRPRPRRESRLSRERRLAMNRFDPSGRVFVLGAGASVFAGYPLAPGLLAFIRNFETREVRAKEIASRVMGKVNDAELHFSRNIIRDPNGVANLEELLTYLELYHSFPGTMFALEPWDASDSANVRLVITQRFLDFQYDLSKKLWEEGQRGSAAAKVTEAWAAMIRPGDVILTFNWDILHEIILWRAGLWSYRDGYGFECGTQGTNDRLSRTQILKLHGSVNWVQEQDTSPIVYVAHVPDFFPGSKDWDWRPHHSEAQSDSGRKLVLPTYLKDISSNRVLLAAWTNAHRVVSEATELTVVGYSLNPVDHPARLLFGTALSQNGALRHVIVVSPETGEWERFLHHIDKPIIPVRQKFEDWVHQKL